jgi:cell division protein FtsB
MFFECQQVRGLTHENQRLKRETEDLQERIGRIERQRDFYQRQCRDAANMGLALLPFPET